MRLALEPQSACIVGAARATDPDPREARLRSPATIEAAISKAQSAGLGDGVSVSRDSAPWVADVLRGYKSVQGKASIRDRLNMRLLPLADQLTLVPFLRKAFYLLLAPGLTDEHIAAHKTGADRVPRLADPHAHLAEPEQSQQRFVAAHGGSGQPNWVAAQ